uniref:Serpentine receptor class gamma n=2 Tax=Panagrellus redivivus TaxID=6233 RepID=A0A7E4UVR5_PANRE
MFKACFAVPGYTVFYYTMYVITVVIIFWVTLMAILIGVHLRREGSPLNSSYYKLVFVGCVSNVLSTTLYKISSTLAEHAEDSNVAALTMAAFIAWLAPYALSMANLMVVLNRSTSLLCPVKHNFIWSPGMTGIIIVGVFLFPFVADISTVFDPCRFRIFALGCEAFMISDCRYGALISFIVSTVSLTLAAVTLYRIEKKGISLTHKMKKNFIFQTVVASSSMTGFSVMLWLSVSMMALKLDTPCCYFKLGYEIFYLIYIGPSYLAHFFVG